MSDRRRSNASNTSQSSSASGQQVHYDSENHPYYIVNGARVYLRSATTPAVGSNASNAATYPSRATGFTDSLGNPIYSSSDPTHNRVPTTQRQLLTGHAQANYGGHYAATAQGQHYQTSAPPTPTPLPPNYQNPYQSAMNPHGTGPPPSSSMTQDYKDYKYYDQNAMSAHDTIKGIYSAGGPVGPKGSRSTHAGHRQVVSTATSGIASGHAAQQGRADMANDYVGYDSKDGAAGHTVRGHVMRKATDYMGKKQAISQAFSDSESDEDPKSKGKGRRRRARDPRDFPPGPPPGSGSGGRGGGSGYGGGSQTVY